MNKNLSGETVLDCPFCGSSVPPDTLICRNTNLCVMKDDHICDPKSHLYRFFPTYSIYCKNCGCSVRGSSDLNDARVKWNTRTITDNDLIDILLRKLINDKISLPKKSKDKFSLVLKKLLNQFK